MHVTYPFNLGLAHVEGRLISARRRLDFNEILCTPIRSFGSRVRVEMAPLEEQLCKRSGIVVHEVGSLPLTHLLKVGILRVYARVVSDTTLPVVSAEFGETVGKAAQQFKNLKGKASSGVVIAL
jgi:hypothetical protein